MKHPFSPADFGYQKTGLGPPAHAPHPFAKNLTVIHFLCRTRRTAQGMTTCRTGARGAQFDLENFQGDGKHTCQTSTFGVRFLQEWIQIFIPDNFSAHRSRRFDYFVKISPWRPVGEDLVSTLHSDVKLKGPGAPHYGLAPS